MRTLCVNLQNSPRNPLVAENFLIFSPRVHYREPGLVFADIGSTAHLFGTEDRLLDEVLGVASEFYPDASAAIADSPLGAQVFTHHPELYIVPPALERDEIYDLPLAALNHLEGLVAWHSVQEIEEIISFFQALGLKKIRELDRFNVEAFRERWGDTGALLWKRLHGLDRQVISPLVPSESLLEYLNFDFPVSLLPFLLHCIEGSLKRLLSRLQGRGEFAQKIQLHLYCEYSSQAHLIQVEPASPGRNRELLLQLIENKLVALDLENPIRQIEVEAVPVSEKLQQLDFWEPQVRDKEKIQRLVSLFHQAELVTGHFKPQDEILPEKSWSLTPEFENHEGLEDEVFEEVSQDGQSFKLKPSFSHHLQGAPRPSRFLKKPRRLWDEDVRRLQFLSHHPVERLEEGWWQSSRGRDYYVAISPQGQTLWVFLDRVENEYYLHGYFD